MWSTSTKLVVAASLFASSVGFVFRHQSSPYHGAAGATEYSVAINGAVGGIHGPSRAVMFPSVALSTSSGGSAMLHLLERSMALR